MLFGLIPSRYGAFGSMLKADAGIVTYKFGSIKSQGGRTAARHTPRSLLSSPGSTPEFFVLIEIVSYCLLSVWSLDCLVAAWGRAMVRTKDGIVSEELQTEDHDKHRQQRPWV
jgi:hypothetical protein